MSGSNHNAALPTRNFDLGDYHSDSLKNSPGNMTKVNDRVFLAALNTTFDQLPRLHKLLGYRPVFINNPLHGYAWYNIPLHSTPRAPYRVDRYIYGHPSGMPFAKMQEFALHVVNVVRGNVGGCACVVCMPVGFEVADVEGGAERGEGVTPEGSEGGERVAPATV